MIGTKIQTPNDKLVDKKLHYLPKLDDEQDDGLLNMYASVCDQNTQSYKYRVICIQSVLYVIVIKYQYHKTISISVLYF